MIMTLVMVVDTDKVTLTPNSEETLVMDSQSVTNLRIDSLFRREKEIRIRFPRTTEVSQYMIMYTTQFSCEKAHFSFDNYEDYGGWIHLSEFCGHASQVCKLARRWIVGW